MPKKPAKTRKRELLVSGITYIGECLAFLILLLVITFNLEVALRSQKVLAASSEVTFDSSTNLLEEKYYWENIIKAHPGYRDAYLELADINEQLGDSKIADLLRSKALEIDPN